METRLQQRSRVSILTLGDFTGYGITSHCSGEWTAQLESLTHRIHLMCSLKIWYEKLMYEKKLAFYFCGHICFNCSQPRRSAADVLVVIRSKGRADNKARGYFRSCDQVGHSTHVIKAARPNRIHRDAHSIADDKRT